ncbi:MAG: hypothetical protein GPJ54_17845 [Candidatus Heimdallarchaeota archaeon]|nr:hypothetical protein [Candidatus Heimdallarchaeota archaeon]
MLFKQGRAVSPVIATILLISVSLAAGTAISVILSNIEDSTPTVQTDSALGVVGSSSVSDSEITTEVTKLSGDILFIQQEIFDYVKLTIELTYTGSNAFIYVIDFDILVYGIKLDDISPWRITSAPGAELTSVDGGYGGYKHANGDSVNYVIEVADPDNARARVPDQTTFSYEVKIGKEPGIISDKVLKERESKVIFNFISYNVSIFHWGSTFQAQEAAKQLEDTLTTINGTNNLFFIYSRAIDAYDISDPAVISSMNVTAINEKYEMVLVDKWVVPTGAGTVITQIHEAGTSLVFYGTLIDFSSGNNKDPQDAIDNIDYVVTENITGLVPMVYDQGGNVRGTQNSYRFFSALDGVLTGLGGQTFEEVPSQINQLFQRTIGDTEGFDAAALTPSPEGFDVLGNATYEFYDTRREADFGPATLIWDNNGPLLIRKNKVTNVSGEVYSFTWKTHENFNDNGATKTDEYHLANIRENMILSLVSELERQTFEYAELTIDALALTVRGGNTRFKIEVTATVTNADINGATLEVTIDLPDALSLNTGIFSTPRYAMYVNGSQVVSNEFFGIDLDTNDNTFFIDVGQVYTNNIPENTQVRIVIDGLAGWLRLNNADTNFYDWFVNMDYQSGVFALPGNDFYTLNTAISTAEW